MHASSLFRSLLSTPRKNRGFASRLVAAWSGMMLLMLFTHAHSAESVEVEASRHGDTVQVQAQATVTAPQSLIWSTLTDYNHLANFIPGMNRSRLINRQGKVSTVEQSGYARLWFFKFPIDVTVEATEQSESTIKVKLIKGNLKQLEGSYDVERIGNTGRYNVRWTGVIEPEGDVPMSIAARLMRKNISEQFLGMVNEIERRATLQAQVNPG